MEKRYVSGHSVISPSNAPSRGLIGVLVAASLILGACGKLNINPARKDSGVLKGAVENFTSISSSQKSGKFAGCTDGAVRLFELTDEGQKDEMVAETNVDNTGQFEFTGLKALGLDFKNELTATSHILEFECGTKIYQRFVTGSTDQIISEGTTLLSWALNTEVKEKVHLQIPSVWQEFYESISSASSQTEAFSTINSSPELKNKFQKIFGQSTDLLLNAPPKIVLTTVPSSLSEGSSSTFSIQAHHWSVDYDIAYYWKLGSTYLSNASSFNHTPNPNSQGTYTLQAFVGKDNGMGAFDSTKPYTQQTFSVTVQNNLPAVPPNIARISDEFTSAATAQVRITTGALTDGTHQYCKTFSKLALVEEAFPATGLAPVSPSSYTIACTDTGTQDISINLDQIQGARTLRLWAIDASNNVSLTSKNLTLVFDSLAPSVALTSLNGGQVLKGGSNAAITWTVTDPNLTSLPISLHYSYDSGSTWNVIASNLANSGTYTWSVPSVNENSVRVRVTAIDKAGNADSAESTTDFAIDSAAPSPPVITRTSASPSNSRTITLGITCDTDYAQVYLSSTATAPNGTEGDWMACLSTANFTVPAGDGTKNIYIWSKDGVGHISTSFNSVSMVLDQTAPNLTITGPAVNFATQSNITLTGACETGLAISVSGDTGTTSGTCTASAYSIALSLTGADGTRSITLSQTDASGNTKTVSRNFIKDTTPPVIQSLAINGGEANTGNRNVVIDFVVTSNRVDIADFCLTLNSDTAPDSSNACWRTLASVSEDITDSLTISELPHQVGAILGSYEIRLWMRDSLGNTTVHTETSGKDLADIFYSPDPPPVISAFLAAKTDTPSNPLVSTDTTVTINSNIYVKWNISDNRPIPAGKIALSYSTNEVNFLPLANNLSDGANGACTVDPGYSGCALLTNASPTSSYYKIKIEVVDDGENRAILTSNPLNTGTFRLLSGNTSLGFGGSGASAVLLGRGEANFSDEPDPQAFVVTKKGYIFYNYLNRGLSYISPETGQINILIPQTGSSAGDGGAAENATLKTLRKIILDHNDNLLLFDDKTIRRVNLSSTPWTISKVAGGTVSSDDGTLAVDAILPTLGREDLFTATPDGKIYYQNGKQLWYYDPTDFKVHHKLTISGLGSGDMSGARANYDVGTCATKNLAIAYDKSNSSITRLIGTGQYTTAASCGALAESTNWDASFNLSPSTGATIGSHPPTVSWSSYKFTGLDGRIYVLEQGRRRLLRFEPTTNTYSDVITSPSTVNGRCIDGSFANQCPAIVMDAFVNSFGKVYFLDMGVLRTIDEAGRVQTLAGQPRNYGVGEDPISARYSQINFFSVADDNVYVVNKLENHLVKFSLNGGSLQHIAGNTTNSFPSNNSVAATTGLPNCSWGMPCGIYVDPVLDRLYYRGGNRFSYIDLSTGKWVIGSSAVQGDSRISYLGGSPDKILAYVPTHHGGAQGNRVTLREFNSSGSDLIVYGQDVILTSLATSLCENVLGTDCTLGHTMNTDVQTQAKYDAFTNSWLIGYYEKSTINYLPVGGGITTRATNPARGVRAFDFRRDASNNLIIYYCGNNGRLYQRTTWGTPIETELTLPTSTMSCAGNAFHYHSGRHSLIFIFKQNDLYGIGEYKL